MSSTKGWRVETLFQLLKQRIISQAETSGCSYHLPTAWKARSNYSGGWQLPKLPSKHVLEDYSCAQVYEWNSFSHILALSLSLREFLLFTTDTESSCCLLTQRDLECGIGEPLQLCTYVPGFSPAFSVDMLVKCVLQSLRDKNVGSIHIKFYLVGHKSRSHSARTVGWRFVFALVHISHNSTLLFQRLPQNDCSLDRGE